MRSLNICPSKVMLKIMLNRLKPLAEKIVAEEQAGFRAGRSTTEQVFNNDLHAVGCKGFVETLN